jgi:NAD(P)-dependent dehydrogenase (short-subunit alcohol dehydrogenase family)
MRLGVLRRSPTHDANMSPHHTVTSTTIGRDMSALTGRVIIVTGSGRGIGRAIAIGAAGEGAKVVIADQGATLHGGAPDAHVAEEVAASIRALDGDAIAVADTVTTMEGARRFVDAAVDTWGRLDGVVCAAGILRHRPFLELTEEDFDAVVATHLKGHFTMFQAAMTVMVDQGRGGSLIGISSGYLSGDPSRAPYRSAKAAVIALTKSVAMAGAEHGVRANVIAPMANTRMTEASGLRFDSDPEDIAPAAVYLLSDRSSHITGTVFNVSGNTIGTWRDPQEARVARHHERWGQSDIDAIMPWLLDDTAGRSVPPAPPTASPPS